MAAIFTWAGSKCSIQHLFSYVFIKSSHGVHSDFAKCKQLMYKFLTKIYFSACYILNYELGISLSFKFLTVLEFFYIFNVSCRWQSS